MKSLKFKATFIRALRPQSPHGVTAGDLRNCRPMEPGTIRDKIPDMTTMTLVRLSRAERQTVKELLEYVELHYAEKITAEGLAEQFSLPIKKMQAAVQANTGRTLYNHILALRLEAAKVMILEDEPLKTVARAVGYKYPSQFGVFFKRLTGLTPAEFRNMNAA